MDKSSRRALRSINGSVYFGSSQEILGTQKGAFFERVRRRERVDETSILGVGKSQVRCV